LSCVHDNRCGQLLARRAWLRDRRSGLDPRELFLGAVERAGRLFALGNAGVAFGHCRIALGPSSVALLAIDPASSAAERDLRYARPKYPSAFSSSTTPRTSTASSSLLV